VIYLISQNIERFHYMSAYTYSSFQPHTITPMFGKLIDYNIVFVLSNYIITSGYY